MEEEREDSQKLANNICVPQSKDEGNIDLPVKINSSVNSLSCEIQESGNN